MSVSVAPGGLADAEREVAGFSPHRDDEVPARRGLRVDHQVLHDLDADVPRGLVAERAMSCGRSKSLSIVFGTCTTRELAPRGLGQAMRAEAVSSPPMVMSMPTPSRISDSRVLREELRILGRVRARDAEVRAAAKVDAARVGDGERHDVRGVALHEPAEAVVDAEHLDAGEARANGRRADDAVDAGGGAAADQDGERLSSMSERAVRASSHPLVIGSSDEFYPRAMVRAARSRSSALVAIGTMNFGKRTPEGGRAHHRSGPSSGASPTSTPRTSTTTASRRRSSGARSKKRAR